MKQRPRIYYTDSQKALMWGRWQKGDSLQQIAQTRYVMLVKVTGKDSETVINALIKHASKMPQELYKSLTWDRGKEMAQHKRFTVATDIKVYFCNPQSLWREDRMKI